MKKSIFLKTAAMFLMVLSFNLILIAATSVKTTNAIKPKSVAFSKSSDADIVRAIRRKLARNSNIKKQMGYINISSKRGIVTISGWAEGKGVKRAIFNYASGTKGVKRVKMLLCGRCQKLCPDGSCISICDWCARKATKCGPGQKLFKNGCIPTKKRGTCPPCSR